MQLKKIRNFRRLYRIISSPDKYIFQQLTFLLHDLLISIRYRDSKDYYSFEISKTLLNSLNKWHQDESNILIKKNINTSNLLLRKFSQGKKMQVKENIDKYIINFSNMPQGLQKSLHSEIRFKISKHVGSPFAIVNTRSWKVIPNNKKFGPSKFHRDGFWPGHLKVMIYLQKNEL